MTIYQPHTSKINQALNFLIRNLEIFCVFFLFISFLDADLGDYEKTINTVSYGVVLFLISLQWKRFLYVGTRDITLLLLIVVAALSYFWSAAPQFTIDEFKSYWRAVFVGVYFASRYQPKELMQLLALMFGLAAFLNLLYAGFAIATGNSDLAITMTNDEPSWKGLLEHKQELGRMMVHSCIILLLTCLKNVNFRKYGWIGFCCSIVLLILSKSKTSWVTFLFSLSLLPILKFAKFKYRSRTFIYIALVLIISSIAVLVTSNLETIVVDILRKPADFNGRFDVWALSIESALKRPWLGYGYSGFWTSSESDYILVHTWAAAAGVTRFQAHNGFIDLFLQLGFLGMSIFLVNFIATLNRVVNILHSTRTIESLWMLEFLILSVVLQLTESLTLVSLNTLCSIYVSIVLSTIIWQNKIKRSAVIEG